MLKIWAEQMHTLSIALFILSKGNAEENNLYK